MFETGIKFGIRDREEKAEVPKLLEEITVESISLSLRKPILRDTKVILPFLISNDLHSNTCHLLIFYWYRHITKYFVCVISFEIAKIPIK